MGILNDLFGICAVTIWCLLCHDVERKKILFKKNKLGFEPPPTLIIDRSKAVVLVWFLLNVFGVGVSCRKLYSFVGYLYVNGSGSITSVGEERANLSAVVYL